MCDVDFEHLLDTDEPAVEYEEPQPELCEDEPADAADEHPESVTEPEPVAEVPPPIAKREAWSVNDLPIGDVLQAVTDCAGLSSGPNPILQCLELSNNIGWDTLRIAGTDGAQVLYRHIPAKMRTYPGHEQAEHYIQVPAKELKTILASMMGAKSKTNVAKTVDLTVLYERDEKLTDKWSILLECGKRKVELGAIQEGTREDEAGNYDWVYPYITEGDWPKPGAQGRCNGQADLVMPADYLRQNIEAVHWAGVCEKDGLTHYTNALYMHYDDQARLNFVATDGHRLTLRECDGIYVSDEASIDRLLPLEMMNKLLKLLPKDDSAVYMRMSGADTVWLFGDTDCPTVFSIKCIDVKFPPYRRVIPKDFCLKFTADGEVLAEAMKLAATVGLMRDRNPVCYMEIESQDVSGGTLTVSAEAGERSYSETLEIEYQGDNGYWKVAVNPVYVQDAVKAIRKLTGSSNFTTNYTSEVSPLMFTGDELSWACIQMPIRMD